MLCPITTVWVSAYVRPERVDAVRYPLALVASVRVRPVRAAALVASALQLRVNPRVPVAIHDVSSTASVSWSDNELELHCRVRGPVGNVSPPVGLCEIPNWEKTWDFGQVPTAVEK